MNKYDVLYFKLANKFKSEVVESNEKVVSALDVSIAIDERLRFYNTILLKDRNVMIKKLNKSVGTLFPFIKSFKICDVSFEIKDSVAFIHITLSNGVILDITGDKYKAELYTPYGVYCELSSDMSEFIKDNNDVFRIYLGILNEFMNSYPNTNIKFGKNVTNDLDQIIDDGFLYCKVSVSNPKNTHVSFSSRKDYFTAREHTKRYGEINDYVEFYRDELLSKMAINVDDLNPFVKSCVIEYLNNKKKDEMVLSK